MPTRAIGATTAPLGLATSSTPRKPTRVATIMRQVSGSLIHRCAISGVNTGAA